MKKTLAEIAKLIGGEVIGDGGVSITGLNGIEEAKEGDLTFVAGPKYFALAKETKATAIVAPKDFKSSKPLIVTANPSVSFSQIAAVMIEGILPKIKGVHPTAVIAKDAKIGKDVAIGPYVVIESKVEVGDQSAIWAGAYIGEKSRIGQQCIIYPNVTIRERTLIGNRVIIHGGSVLGSDGFGYDQVDGGHKKIPQLGIVVIEDDVEIGSNVTIDRARFDKTLICRGAKIDNLVHIAHNVIIGENCLLVAQVGISGSTVVEKNSILAGQVGLVGHIRIGEGSIIGAQSGVSNSLPPNSKVFGYPAKPIMEAKRLNATIQRLPHYIKLIKELKERVEELESQLKKK